MSLSFKHRSIDNCNIQLQSTYQVKSRKWEVLNWKSKVGSFKWEVTQLLCCPSVCDHLYTIHSVLGVNVKCGSPVFCSSMNTDLTSLHKSQSGVKGSVLCPTPQSNVVRSLFWCHPWIQSACSPHLFPDCCATNTRRQMYALAQIPTSSRKPSNQIKS